MHGRMILVKKYPAKEYAVFIVITLKTDIDQEREAGLRIT